MAMSWLGGRILYFKRVRAAFATVAHAPDVHPDTRKISRARTWDLTHEINRLARMAEKRR